MAFLAKIRNYIKRYKNRDFRTSIEQDRAKKYLFRDNGLKHNRGKWKFFQKTSQKRLSPFSRFLQEKIHTLQSVTSLENLYLSYIGGFLILASLYIIFYSPYFQVSPSKVIIEPVTDGIDLSIAYRTIEDIYGKNVFFINEESIAQSLKNDQKNIKEIKIDRLYPNGIKILLSSYPTTFDVKIVGIDNKAWNMTENGVLVPKNDPSKKGPHALIFHSDDITEDSLLDYKPLMSEPRARLLEKSFGFFEQNWPNLPISTVEYYEQENEFHYKFASGGILLFAFQDLNETQGEEGSYKTFKKELLGVKTFFETHINEVMSGQYVYIDARIPGKIFSCRDKNVCPSNLIAIYGSTTKN